MCGIAGQFAFKGAVTIAATQRACDAMKYRGPDQSGFHAGPHVALGMRRLKVVGLAGGEQPVYSRDHNVIAVFNGEIYNYVQLREELLHKGHVVQGNSDAGVIPALYQEYGPAFVERLHGMFAIALYDKAQHRLTLITDRAGKKPLFYSQTDDGIVFASELSALLQYPGIDRSVDGQVIDQYLSYRIVAAPTSIWKSVRRLEPGTMLEVAAGTCTQQEYWRMQIRPDDAIDEATAEQTVGELLEQATVDRLEAGVPLGAMLSGGLDSSLVVALATKHRSEPLNTFSVDFAEPAFDESVHAQAVAEWCGTQHHRYRISERDAVDAIDPILRHTGEPYAFPSAIASYYMYRLASQHVTVVLTGDGSDEIFGGYNRYKRLAALPADGSDLAERYESVLVDGVRRDIKRTLYSAAFKAAITSPNYLNNRLALTPAGNGDVERAMEMDNRFWLSDAQLVKIDRMAMAHSVEPRSPMLDHRLVEYVARLPMHMKLDGSNEKMILKRVAAPYLPDAIVNRRKQELAVPLESWIAGRLRDAMQTTLLSESSLSRGYFEPDALLRLVKDFQSQHAYALWTLFMLERWHQLFVDGSDEPLSELVGL